MMATVAPARSMFYFQPDNVLEHAPRTGNTHKESPSRACNMLSWTRPRRLGPPTRSGGGKVLIDCVIVLPAAAIARQPTRLDAPAERR
jgi:hypothetical protein